MLTALPLWCCFVCVPAHFILNRGEFNGEIASRRRSEPEKNQTHIDLKKTE